MVTHSALLRGPWRGRSDLVVRGPGNGVRPNWSGAPGSLRSRGPHRSGRAKGGRGVEHEHKDEKEYYEVGASNCSFLLSVKAPRCTLIGWL